MAKCPAHHEKTGSLSISDMGRGKTRLHCFGGCPQEAVLKAAGLAWKDLRPDGEADPEIKGRLADERKLERLQQQHGLMQWLSALEPERKRYWEAAMRRVIQEMEPLYWELMPDKEKQDRATQFEIKDYRGKRLDWLRGRQDGIHRTGSSAVPGEREVRQVGIHGGSSRLPPGGIPPREQDGERSGAELGRGNRSIGEEGAQR